MKVYKTFLKQLSKTRWKKPLRLKLLCVNSVSFCRLLLSTDASNSRRIPGTSTSSSGSDYDTHWFWNLSDSCIKIVFAKWLLFVFIMSMYWRELGVWVAKWCTLSSFVELNETLEVFSSDLNFRLPMQFVR